MAASLLEPTETANASAPKDGTGTPAKFQIPAQLPTNSSASTEEPQSELAERANANA